MTKIRLFVLTLLMFLVTPVVMQAQRVDTSGIKRDTNTKVIVGPSCPCSETNRVVDSALAHMKTPRLDRLTKEMALVKRQIDSLKKVKLNAPMTSVVSDTATTNELARLDSAYTELAGQVLRNGYRLDQLDQSKSAAPTLNIQQSSGMSTGAKWGIGIGVVALAAGVTLAIIRSNSHISQVVNVGYP